MILANAQIERAREFLRTLSEGMGVSGYEHLIQPLIAERFGALTAEVYNDSFGNLYAVKRGTGNGRQIMLAAHCDEIGLMVKAIDSRGFIRFTNIGGIDQRTLLGQEVIIHGRRRVLGVIGSMPPHLISSAERDKAIKMDNLGVDVGMPASELLEVVEVGDSITLKGRMANLLNDCCAGKSFDDRAGVVAMAVCLEELAGLQHQHDVIAVATVQEEVGIRGAITSAYTLNPDLAVAIDVTHAATPDTKGQTSIELGKGPVVALGPNVHPAIYRHFIDTAQLNRLPYQCEPIPGISGTDAWAIQVARSGVPTGLLSIPLRYMHTAVETLALEDVVNAGKLLAYFIAALPESLEGFLCF